MEIKALEKALAYSKITPDAIALVVLKDAVERFLAAQNKAQPATPKSEPGVQRVPELPVGISDLLKRTGASQGCPACGCPDGVPHFCTGRRMYPHGGTGIEYWMNQPRAMGVATNGQRVGGIGSSIGSAQG